MTGINSTRQQSPELSSSRKRVGKACDRCRLKKSKCDGSLPCQRCLADDQICVFSERKRSKDKTYPKGYVELLESRNHALAEALHKVLYCQQQGIDTSSLYPSDGTIVLNEVLGCLENFKGLPSHFKPTRYIDDAIEHFEDEHSSSSQQRRPSLSSSTPSSRASLDLSSAEASSPTTPPDSLLADYSFDAQFLSQNSKMPFYDQNGNLPLSIAPSLLMPDFSYAQSQMNFETAFSMTNDPLSMDVDWI